MSLPKLKKGDKIGDYVLQDFLGNGSFGIVNCIIMLGF